MATVTAKEESPGLVQLIGALFATAAIAALALGALAATRLGEDIAPSLRSRALRRYISAHPEKSLAAYVASDTSKWLGEIAADESDKYAMLAVWNLVNCIAFAELPRSKRTKPT